MKTNPWRHDAPRRGDVWSWCAVRGKAVAAQVDYMGGRPEYRTVDDSRWRPWPDGWPWAPLSAPRSTPDAGGR